MSTEAPIQIPPRGTRGRNAPAFLRKLFEPLADRQVSQLRKKSGPEQAKVMGLPVLLLTTIGARTGQERTHVLGGFRDGDASWLIVASAGGAATHPAWLLNLAKHPDRVWIEVGDRRVKVRPECLQGQEREDAYAKVVAAAPRYRSYPTKTDREIPVLRLIEES